MPHKNKIKISRSLFLCLFIFLLIPSILNAKPLVAIVVDDAGYSLSQCRVFLNIKHPLTIAVIPGLTYSTKCAQEIIKSQHHLFIHFPWSTLSHGQNYEKHYPINLTESMTKEEMGKMLTRAFASVPEAEGINNHMGSQLSSDREAMDKFMSLLSKFKNKKCFLDSRTSRQSKAYYYAKKYDIKTTNNNVFLDSYLRVSYLEQQFRIAVRTAKKNGSAVAICHVNREVTRKNLERLMTKYADQVEYTSIEKIIEFRRSKI